MKSLIQKMKRLGLSPKKELLIFGIVNGVLLAVGITLFIILKNPIILVFSGVFVGIFSILYLSRYGSTIEKINTENLVEFSELFSYFRIYIKNGYNVYNALKEISSFANKNLREMLEVLLEEIDSDKSVKPFINFANNFNEIIIEELMISIYQMIDDGEQSNYLIQFEFIFDKFSESITQKQLQKKNSRLGTFCSSALVASCFLIIVITIGIVGLIGELTNGI